jgi:uroporphyrin-III C-methyltransferase
MTQSILLFGHGARNAEYVEPFRRIRAAMLARDPQARVEIGFLELSQPSLEDAIASLAGQGALEIRIVPIFFAPGRHVLIDLPERTSALKVKYPQLRFEIADAVGTAQTVVDAMAEFALDPERRDMPLFPLTSEPPLPGHIYLVGTGPGDPNLLTLRAYRLIVAADVVLYDNLVGAEIMALLPDAALRVYVGKKRAQHALPQEEINAQLVKHAQQGRSVLRLKGGDPFIFGRGGEEIETLMRQGIPFEVVPGITAALGAAAYAGIPLTHRDHSQACIFVTAHLKDGSSDLDWAALVRPHQTVVIYMGLLGLPEICRQLVAHGMPARTPAAAVEKATTRAQRVIVSSVAELPAAVARASLKGPSLTIVGGVVSLRDQLNWYIGGAS